MSDQAPETFVKLLHELEHRHRPSDIFRSFVCVVACSLANQTREAEYLEAIKPFNRSELDTLIAAFARLILDMEERPFTDLLGPAYMETLGRKDQQCKGEFHTPQEVCRLIGRMMCGTNDLPSSGPITLCEPASGAGAMILAYAEAMSPADRRRLQVTAIDINKICCDMCFINTTLWGIPARILQGNTLSLKFTAGWTNIHMANCLAISGFAFPAQGQPPRREEVVSIAPTLGQMNLEGIG